MECPTGSDPNRVHEALSLLHPPHQCFQCNVAKPSTVSERRRGILPPEIHPSSAHSGSMTDVTASQEIRTTFLSFAPGTSGQGGWPRCPTLQKESGRSIEAPQQWLYTYRCMQLMLTGRLVGRTVFCKRKGKAWSVGRVPFFSIEASQQWSYT